MRKVKEGVSTVPKSKRPCPQFPEFETEAEGSSQRRSLVNSPLNAMWEHFNILNFPEEEFKRAFRMSKATFDMIRYELKSVDKKRDTKLPLAIPVCLRVGVCIWKLATREPFSEVSKRFGLGISMCHNLVLEVCSAICNILVSKFLQWPNEEKMRDIKRGFDMITLIPDIAGSIYTTHVPIIAPEDSDASYFINKRHTLRKQKTSYSITIQGVVDHKGVFTDICVGWPGSMTDDKVLEQSALYQRSNRGLLKDLWIVGNAGFPLIDWVLVPYTMQSITGTQRAYNEDVGKVQSIAKEAFMRLKTRWICLQKNTEFKLQDLPIVLGAYCVLHNICEMRDEIMNPELRCELFDDEVVPKNPVRSVNALQARDKIATSCGARNLDILYSDD